MLTCWNNKAESDTDFIARKIQNLKWMFHTHRQPGSTEHLYNHHTFRMGTEISVTNPVSNQKWNVITISYHGRLPVSYASDCPHTLPGNTSDSCTPVLILYLSDLSHVLSIYAFIYLSWKCFYFFQFFIFWSWVTDSVIAFICILWVFFSLKIVNLCHDFNNFLI